MLLNTVSSAARRVCALAVLLVSSTALYARIAPEFTGPDSQPVAPAQRYSFGPAPQTNLGPIDDSLRDQPARDGLLRVALHRKLKKTDLSHAVWQKGGDGRVWRLSLRSTDAVGVRLHFSNFSIGDGQVWVHDTQNPAKQVFGPYTGKGPLDDGDFWTEIVFSDAIEVEYQAAAGSPANAQPPFQISELSHLWQFGGRVAPRHAPSPAGFNPLADTTSTPRNSSCLRDVTCNLRTDVGTRVWNASSSTAVLIFGDSTGTYQCTGTMLNAANQSPLLLTAGHCINTQEQARSLVALFQALSDTCQLPPFSPMTSDQLVGLPQVSGLRLLSYINQPFLNEGSQQEIHHDLDYSLVLLKTLPRASNWGILSGFSGYSAASVSPGDNLISVSSPYGMTLKLALGTVLPNVWDNGFDVDQTTQGRIGSGSSGSGAFDSNGRLVGVLSTATAPCSNSSQCPRATTCDVNGAFEARYTSFAALYPYIRDYLNQPLDAPANAVTSDPALFSAGPILNKNEWGYGDSTLTMNADSTVSFVEVHVGSPDGPLFYAGSGTGSVTASGWVTDGLVFYLQDVSNHQPLISANTIATAVARLNSTMLTANPPFILFPDKLGNGSLTLDWNVPGASLLELHVGSPGGPLMAAGGSPTGWARAEGWVSEGMTFVLCEVSNTACSVQNTVGTFTASILDVKKDPNSQADYGTISLAAFPNPIPVGAGQTFGQTTLYWRVPGVAEVRVHVGSQIGPLMAVGGSSGSAATGPWVEDGAKFVVTDRMGSEFASVIVHFAKPATK
jgi:hypothetical protein